MKRFDSAVLGVLMLTLAGCELAGDILEFGFWAGVIVVAVVIALVWWLMKRLRGGPRPPA